MPEEEYDDEDAAEKDDSSCEPKPIANVGWDGRPDSRAYRAEGGNCYVSQPIRYNDDGSEEDEEV